MKPEPKVHLMSSNPQLPECVYRRGLVLTDDRSKVTCKSCLNILATGRLSGDNEKDCT